jgi:hypothetical protein
MKTYAGWPHSQRCQASWICQLNQKVAGGGSRGNPVKAKKAMWPHHPSCTPGPNDGTEQQGQTDQQADKQGDQLPVPRWRGHV